MNIKPLSLLATCGIILLITGCGDPASTARNTEPPVYDQARLDELLRRAASLDFSSIERFRSSYIARMVSGGQKPDPIFLDKINRELFSRAGTENSTSLAKFLASCDERGNVAGVISDELMVQFRAAIATAQTREEIESAKYILSITAFSDVDKARLARDRLIAQFQTAKLPPPTQGYLSKTTEHIANLSLSDENHYLNDIQQLGDKDVSTYQKILGQYTHAYPEGKHIQQIKSIVQNVVDDEDKWKGVESGKLPALDYLRIYPNGRHSVAASEKFFESMTLQSPQHLVGATNALLAVLSNSKNPETSNEKLNNLVAELSAKKIKTYAFDLYPSFPIDVLEWHAKTFPKFVATGQLRTIIDDAYNAAKLQGFLQGCTAKSLVAMPIAKKGGECPSEIKPLLWPNRIVFAEGNPTAKTPLGAVYIIDARGAVNWEYVPAGGAEPIWYKNGEWKESASGDVVVGMGNGWKIACIIGMKSSPRISLMDPAGKSFDIAIDEGLRSFLTLGNVILGGSRKKLEFATGETGEAFIKAERLYKIDTLALKYNEWISRQRSLFAGKFTRASIQPMSLTEKNGAMAIMRLIEGELPAETKAFMAEMYPIAIRQAFKQGEIGTRYVPVAEYSYSNSNTSYVNGSPVTISSYKTETTGGDNEKIFGYTSVYEFRNTSAGTLLVTYRQTGTASNLVYYTYKSGFLGMGDVKRGSRSEAKQQDVTKQVILRAGETQKDQTAWSEAEPKDYKIQVVECLEVENKWVDGLQAALEPISDKTNTVKAFELADLYLRDEKASNWRTSLLDQRIRAAKIALTVRVNVPKDFDPDFPATIDIQISNPIGREIRIAASLDGVDGRVSFKVPPKGGLFSWPNKVKGIQKDRLRFTIEDIEDSRP